MEKFYVIKKYRMGDPESFVSRKTEGYDTLQEAKDSVSKKCKGLLNMHTPFFIHQDVGIIMNRWFINSNGEWIHSDNKPYVMR